MLRRHDDHACVIHSAWLTLTAWKKTSTDLQNVLDQSNFWSGNMAKGFASSCLCEDALLFGKIDKPRRISGKTEIAVITFIQNHRPIFVEITRSKLCGTLITMIFAEKFRTKTEKQKTWKINILLFHCKLRRKLKSWIFSIFLRFGRVNNQGEAKSAVLISL